MAEQQWLKCDEPLKLLLQLQGKMSARKARLFGCACWGRAKYYPEEPLRRRALEMLEEYADRRVKRREAMAAVKMAIQGGALPGYFTEFFWSAHCTDAAFIVSQDAFPWAVYEYVVGARDVDLRPERRTHADVLRDIVGNPFHPVAVTPAWRTPAAVALARTAYEERHFEDLPLLADALEEAGCTDDAILTHLRGSGPHVRGCWVVDLVLEKE